MELKGIGVYIDQNGCGHPIRDVDHAAEMFGAGSVAHLCMRGERIEGWKGIAAHLNIKPFRLLRVWRAEGVPVRRLTRNRVMAWSGELDAWMASRPLLRAS